MCPVSVSTRICMFAAASMGQGERLITLLLTGEDTGQEHSVRCSLECYVARKKGAGRSEQLAWRDAK